MNRPALYNNWCRLRNLDRRSRLSAGTPARCTPLDARSGSDVRGNHAPTASRSPLQIASTRTIGAEPTTDTVPTQGPQAGFRPRPPGNYYGIGCRIVSRSRVRPLSPERPLCIGSGGAPVFHWSAEGPWRRSPPACGGRRCRRGAGRRRDTSRRHGARATTAGPETAPNRGRIDNLKYGDEAALESLTGEMHQRPPRTGREPGTDGEARRRDRGLPRRTPEPGRGLTAGGAGSVRHRADRVFGGVGSRQLWDRVWVLDPGKSRKPL